MQQKRHYYSRAGVLLMALLGVSVGVVVVLMIKDITPPQQPIEKQIDASAFVQK